MLSSKSVNVCVVAFCACEVRHDNRITSSNFLNEAAVQILAGDLGTSLALKYITVNYHKIRLRKVIGQSIICFYDLLVVSVSRKSNLIAKSYF